jgi:hypothetical protein
MEAMVILLQCPYLQCAEVGLGLSHPAQSRVTIDLEKVRHGDGERAVRF